MRWEDVKPEHLSVIPDVKVSSIHFEERFVQYFEVEYQGEVVKIRVGSQEAMDWIKSHQDVELTLTIFPYKWELNGRSGVINYFKNAATHPSSTQ